MATGLAMAQSVEMAEDKARERTLALLGITASTQQPSSLKATTSQVIKETSERESVGNGVTEESPEPTSDDQWDSSLEEEAVLADLEDDLGPPIHHVVEEPLSEASQEMPPQTISAATVALENFNTSALPVDLSDVIAQTDVELRRLGWTSMQGREYLERTYGKRSRQQLTDDELMSFLLYLEAQQT